MERLLKSGLISTVLGLAIILFCCVMMYKEKATNTELAGYFALGLALLRANDTILGIKKKDEKK